MTSPTENDADFKMMNSPGEWPMWPRLPLKRVVDGKRETAVLAAVFLKKDFPMLFFPNANIWQPLGNKEQIMIRDADGLRELVEAGWIVD